MAKQIDAGNNANVWDRYFAKFCNEHLAGILQEIDDKSSISSKENREELNELRKQLTELFHGQQLAMDRMGEAEELRKELDEMKARFSVLEFEKEQIAINVRNNNDIIKKIQLNDGLAAARNSEKWSLFNKVTNSQAGEDSIVAYVARMVGKPFEQCSYIDLGANHPVEMSNTYFFYSFGAKGVLVDANDALCRELRSERPGDVVLNNAVSGRSGETVEFNILNTDGLSLVGSIEELQKENKDIKLERTVSIETICYNDIVDKYMKEAPFLLNIDIEGREMDILRSIDFENKRPFILVVEMTPYSIKLVVGEKNQEIMDFMESVGYAEYAFTGINSIFIDKRALEAGEN